MVKTPCNGGPNSPGDDAKFFLTTCPSLRQIGSGGCKLETRFLRINAADEVLSVNEGFP